MGQGQSTKSAVDHVLDDAKKYIEKKDYYNAIITLQPHTVSNNIEIILLLSKIYLAACEYNNAVPILRHGVDLKDPECMYLLGDIYYYGRDGNSRRKSDAYTLFTSATEANFEKARCMLAKCCKGQQRAIELYNIGERNNCSECIYQLGKIKFMADKVTGIRLLERAAISNNIKALYRLGKIYLDDKQDGIGMNYLRRAATKNNPKACKIIGDRYMFINKYNEALEFYMKGDIITSVIDIIKIRYTNELNLKLYEQALLYVLNHQDVSYSSALCQHELYKYESQNRDLIKKLTKLNIIPVLPPEKENKFTSLSDIDTYHLNRLKNIHQLLEAQCNASPDNPQAPIFLEAKKDWEYQMSTK